jgi:hypothetical protein
VQHGEEFKQEDVIVINGDLPGGSGTKKKATPTLLLSRVRNDEKNAKTRRRKSGCEEQRQHQRKRVPPAEKAPRSEVGPYRRVWGSGLRCLFSFRRRMRNFAKGGPPERLAQTLAMLRNAEKKKLSSLRRIDAINSLYFSLQIKCDHHF